MNQRFWTNRMRKCILSFWKSWLSVRISDSLIKMATCQHLIWQSPYQSNLTLTILTKLTSKQFWCIPDDLTRCFLFVESYKSILLISVPVWLLFNEALFEWVLFLLFHFTSKHALMHLCRAAQKAIHAGGIDRKRCRTQEVFSWGFLMETHCDESQASILWLIMLLTSYKSLSPDSAGLMKYFTSFLLRKGENKWKYVLLTSTG